MIVMQNSSFLRKLHMPLINFFKHAFEEEINVIFICFFKIFFFLLFLHTAGYLQYT